MYNEKSLEGKKRKQIEWKTNMDGYLVTIRQGEKIVLTTNTKSSNK